MNIQFPKLRIIISRCLGFEIYRFNDEYILNQSYFKPFPMELIEIKNDRLNL